MEVAEDTVVVMAITRVVTGVEIRVATMKDTEVDMEEDKVNYNAESSWYTMSDPLFLCVNRSLYIVWDCLCPPPFLVLISHLKRPLCSANHNCLLFCTSLSIG